MNFSVAHAILGPYESSYPHRIESSVEVYYILEGEGLMCIDDEQAPVGPGKLVYIPPGSVQNVKNITSRELKFLCIVSPPWRRENDELSGIKSLSSLKL